MKTWTYLTVGMIAVFSLTACEPEVGSEAWCKKTEGVPKGDWTMNQTRDYTKYCVLKIDPEKD